MALTAATKLTHPPKWVMDILSELDNDTLECAEKMAQENNCKIELTIEPRSFSDRDDSVKVYIWKGDDCYYVNEETHKDGSKMVTYMHDIKIKDENGDVMYLENADMQFGDGVRFT